MRCPRCSKKVKSRDMFRHVWQEHHLLLDGDKARKPWELLAQWVREYRRGNHDTPLARCQALGQQLDPRWGVARIECLLRDGEKTSDQTEIALAGDAAAAGVSLCPQCYGFVPSPLELEPFAVSLAHGRLSAHGYHVEVSENGLAPRLLVQTPADVQFHGKEPGLVMTERSGWLLLTGPLILAALLLAVGVPDLGIAPIWLVLPLFLIAVGVHWFLRSALRKRPNSNVRAIMHAWSTLAPSLHTPTFSRADSGFLAGLALATVTEGTVDVNKEALQRLLEITQKAAVAGAGVMRHLGALWRLALQERARTGLDLGQMIAGQLQRCFEGALSFAFVEGLMADWQPDNWTTGERARLRIMVCERAFEAGFEVADLIEAGQDAPSLGRLVGNNASALAQLRLLWSLRPRRPWDRFGAALSAFEVAELQDATRILAANPDLLLWAKVPAVRSVLDNGLGSPEARIAICARGVCFQEEVLTEFPRTIEVVSQTASRQGRHELVIGDRRFPFLANPEPLAAQLERWLRYYFGEFSPQVTEVGRWQSPDLAAVWRSRGSVACPDCGSTLLPRVGEVGLSLEAYEKARQKQDGPEYKPESIKTAGH
jgi:hypothetical protein